MMIKKIIPLFLLLGLGGLLAHELLYSTPAEITSELIGENIPEFKLPNLYHSEKMFTSQDLRGKVALLNVWATWCDACTEEEAMLRKIHDTYHIPIYGITYRDDANKAKKQLNKRGNPYVLIGDDKSGDVSIDLGIYGTPETFIISPQGKIVYRHVGAIDQKNWDEVLYPLVKKYAAQY
jgi:cytochrome c biogenesis protein CcmG/thiol:disulfide interchange protein DsbE